MNAHVERGMLLYQQSRPEMAEAELRQALASEPHDSYAHSLLALCLAQREQFQEATAEAQEAIHLEPDSAFAHYAHAHVLSDRNRLAEAQSAIEEAIRLDSADADYFTLLANIQFQQHRWQKALQASEEGLQFDPEHIGCTNLRAMAMVKLGRRAEAGQTIDAALAKNPESAITHANQGWTLLEKGEPKKAAEHFRESLRLDPENEWARRGMIEALKARHIVYALMLKYFLWMSRFSPRGQWGIILGGYFGNQLLRGIAASNPKFAPWVLPLRIAYFCFALMTWMASPFFNLLLRINRFGRLVLSREETVASNWFGICLACALISVFGWLIYGSASLWLIAAMIFGFLLLPVSAVFKCPAGSPRNIMAVLACCTAALGLTALGGFWVAASKPTVAAARESISMAEGCFSLFLVGAVASSWLTNILRSRRVLR